jgi:hypothetical protein
LVVLFEVIYDQKALPEQCLIAKTIPIDVENHGPIANLCSLKTDLEKNPWNTKIKQL